MKTAARILLVLLSLAVVPGAAVEAARKSKGKTEPGTGTAGVKIERWLALGPVVDPLPLFHDEKPGGFDLEARLGAEVFPEGAWMPEEGRQQAWFTDRTLTWAARSAGADGLVELEVPEGVGEGRPGAAWLAAYVEVDRFRKLQLEVPGVHPRRVWVDGALVASGGAGAEAGEVKGETKLTTGKHLVIVETLYDPAKAKEGWEVGALFSGENDTADPALVSSLDPSRTLAIRDFLDPPSIRSIAMSPDGKFSAVVFQRYYPGTDKRESWLEIWGTWVLRTLRVGLDIDQVAWAPAGSKVTYVTSEGEGEERTSTLWMSDTRSNKVEPLLERVKSFAGYRWSPDGKKIAYLTSVEPEKDERGIKRLESVRDRWADYRTKRYLNLLSVPGGVRRRLTAGPLTTDGIDFSADGKKLLFTRSMEDFGERPFSVTELWELDLGSYEAKRLRRSRWLGSARYSPSGDRLLIQAGAAEFGEAGLKIPEGMISNSYDGQLFVWNPETDEVDPITRDFDPAVNSAVWSRADGNIYLTASDRDYVRLYRYDTGPRAFTPYDTGVDVFRQMSVAENAALAMGTGTSPWKHQSLVSVELAGGRRHTLVQPAFEWFGHVRMGTVEPWTFDASNGKTIEGRVYLPPGFDPSRKYPGIVYYYGGTNPISRSFGGRYPKEYWASHGYVVYTLQPSGATGFGQEFSAAHVNDWGKTTSEEIIEGTRKFLDAHPYVDAERVGCIGASYGGFMTMLLSTKTDLFAAAVSHAGISSLSSYWGEGYWGYSYSSVATADSYPWNRPDIYVDQSPLFRADRQQVPILLTHGAADTNVPVGESDQFYVALKLLGRDVEYLQVAGQDHWILDHDKRIVWSESILAWFDRWLKDQPEWWEDLHPERE